ncbi:MAG: hypothetical protein LBU34_17055 [Planctomycetaceae bacterium]|nr:hypothetical protein [Planctomycetaceae bacterium]
MCIALGGAKRNLRIGIFQGRQPLAAAVASALADSEFMPCWLFGLPVGKRPFGERSPTFC